MNLETPAATLPDTFVWSQVTNHSVNPEMQCMSMGRQRSLVSRYCCERNNAFLFLQRRTGIL